ncbi:hypothetical protein ACFY3N_36455 [Streptomyces sp. NPDC000348]|uniref:hypothetical protein n=1 Tax=Streptomyces sp. NPDC000348 TaxID=3364538 RepID=UPI0036B9DFA0
MTTAGEPDRGEFALGADRQLHPGSPDGRLDGARFVPCLLDPGVDGQFLSRPELLRLLVFSPAERLRGPAHIGSPRVVLLGGPRGTRPAAAGPSSALVAARHRRREGNPGAGGDPLCGRVWNCAEGRPPHTWAYEIRNRSSQLLQQ